MYYFVALRSYARRGRFLQHEEMRKKNAEEEEARKLRTMEAQAQSAEGAAPEPEGRSCTSQK